MKGESSKGESMKANIYMSGLLKGALCAAFLLAGTFLFAASVTNMVVLENTDSGDISFISVPEHEVVRTIQLEKYVDDISASSDGKTLYVNRVKSLGNPMMLRAGDSGEIYAIDTLSGKIKWTMQVDGWPHHMTLSRDDRYLYIPLFDALEMLVVDVQQQKVVKRIQVPLGAHGTRLSPDGNSLYVGSMLNDLIVVYDLASGSLKKAIPFADGVRPLAITRDEKRMYVQLSHLNGFKVVDLESDKIIREVAMPPLPEGTMLPAVYPHTVNHGLELSPDEKYLLAASSLTKSVVVFSHPQLEVVKIIPVGDEPNWIIFSDDSKYAYISNRKSNELSVVDMHSLQEIKRIPVGQRPQRMRFLSLQVQGK